MSVSVVKIVDAAMRLRAHAPEDWAEFVAAMREYAAAQASEMVRCSPEMLNKAQGMAQTATDIAMTLHHAPQLYDKMKNNG
jgi:hypothetical protein